MFSDNTTVCTTHDQFVTEVTDSYFGNTKEATSTPQNYGSSTVASFTDPEPESIPISTSQGTYSIIVTTAAAICCCSDCTLLNLHIVIIFGCNDCRICICF